jgi:hypothetical protein
MGGNWARIGHALGTSTGETRHGPSMSGLGLGEGHDTGRLGTGGHGTSGLGTGTGLSTRARAGWARSDCVRTSRVPTSHNSIGSKNFENVEQVEFPFI